MPTWRFTRLSIDAVLDLRAHDERLARATYDEADAAPALVALSMQ